MLENVLDTRKVIQGISEDVAREMSNGTAIVNPRRWSRASVEFTGSVIPIGRLGLGLRRLPSAAIARDLWAEDMKAKLKQVVVIRNPEAGDFRGLHLILDTVAGETTLEVNSYGNSTLLRRGTLETPASHLFALGLAVGARRVIGKAMQEGKAHATFVQI